MSKAIRLAAYVIALCLLTNGAVSAQGTRLNSEDYHPDDPRYEPIFEGAEEDWKEDKFQFPDIPNDDDLLAFEVPGSPHRHYIDTHSLSIGKDEVLRFTVVVEAGTTRNILYEGMRCTTREFRSMGFTTGERAFRERRNNQWRRLYSTVKGANWFRWVLWDRYLCDDAGQWMSVDEVVARLRSGYAQRAGPVKP
ncbi:MAG: hypothetical protein ACI9W2_004457 [Gammaproteobacteria bacterium]|jgi:hypothetical protein